MKDETLYGDAAAHLYLDRRIEDLHHRRLLDSVLLHLGACRGDSMIEIGAGSGRYTEVLLSRGYQVSAYEPDPHLYAKLLIKYRNIDDLKIRPMSIRELVGVDVRAEFICGFHVLHHLNGEHLQMLASVISGIRERSPKFKGWFFLEPNPLNVLYPLSILLTPGMKFREERGLWRLGYRMLRTRDSSKSELLGSIGIFPPRRIFSKLPPGVANLGTELTKRRNIFSLYNVVGEIG